MLQEEERRNRICGAVNDITNDVKEKLILKGLWALLELVRHRGLLPAQISTRGALQVELELHDDT